MLDHPLLLKLFQSEMSDTLLTADDAALWLWGTPVSGSSTPQLATNRLIAHIRMGRAIHSAAKMFKLS